MILLWLLRRAADKAERRFEEYMERTDSYWSVFEATRLSIASKRATKVYHDALARRRPPADS